MLPFLLVALTMKLRCVLSIPRRGTLTKRDQRFSLRVPSDDRRRPQDVALGQAKAGSDQVACPGRRACEDIPLSHLSCDGWNLHSNWDCVAAGSHAYHSHPSLLDLIRVWLALVISAAATSAIAYVDVLGRLRAARCKDRAVDRRPRPPTRPLAWALVLEAKSALECSLIFL